MKTSLKNKFYHCEDCGTQYSQSGRCVHCGGDIKTVTVTRYFPHGKHVLLAVLVGTIIIGMSFLAIPTLPDGQPMLDPWEMPNINGSSIQYIDVTTELDNFNNYSARLQIHIGWSYSFLGKNMMDMSTQYLCENITGAIEAGPYNVQTGSQDSWETLTNTGPFQMSVSHQDVDVNTTVGIKLTITYKVQDDDYPEHWWYKDAVVYITATYDPRIATYQNELPEIAIWLM